MIAALRIGPDKNFAYLIFCPMTGKGALVDAAYEFDRVLDWIKGGFLSSGASQPANIEIESSGSPTNIEIEYLIATHGHRDHAGGLIEFKKFFPRAKILTYKLEHDRLSRLGVTPDVEVSDGDEFKIGDILVKAIHTPGHTEGGCCFLVDGELLSGDTLFVGQCGRTDLQGGSDKKLFESLQKLKTLPPKTIVRPGHDYGRAPVSTIEDEMKTNPVMLVKNLSEFKALP